MTARQINGVQTPTRLKKDMSVFIKVRLLSITYNPYKSMRNCVSKALLFYRYINNQFTPFVRLEFTNQLEISDVSIENLPNGFSYAGEVDIALKPSGKGTSFRPDGHVEYIGFFKNGLKQGKGTLFYENGKKAYRGSFRKGLITGRGTMYYPNGQVLATGTFKNGNLERGKMRGEDGEIIKKEKLKSKVSNLLNSD